MNLPRVNMEEVKSRNDSITNDSQASTKNLHAPSNANNSSRNTPRGLAGASVSYKERRDLYKMKSSGKVRESSAPSGDDGTGSALQ